MGGGGGGAVPVGIQDTSLGHLIDPNRKWYNNRRLIILHAWIVLILITSSTNGYDGSLMNGLQSLPQWESAFNNPSGGTLGLLNAVQNIGGLAGYPFAPYMSDGFGRRRAVWLGAFIMCIAVALQSASESMTVFVVARFLVGFGLTFAANAAPMLVTEISYPTYRAPLTSLYNSLWYSGSVIAAWTTYSTINIDSSWAWRLPLLLQGVPSVLQVALVLCGPESPRWLMSKGRDEEALRTLAYYHADGNESDPLVQYEFQEIKAALKFDHTVASNVGWKSLFTTPGNRKRMRIIVAIAFFSQWSGMGLVSFYLNMVFDQVGITDSSTQLFINGILQIWNLAWAIYAAFMVDRLGRRFLFLASAGLMTLFYAGQTICYAEYSQHGSTSAGHAFIVFVFLFCAAYDIAFTPLVVSYTLEILPYSLRATGFNVLSIVISAALIVNQYINPIAVEALGWKYYLVYVFWLAFEFVFLWFFLVETKNRTLEETASLFDGDHAVGRITRQAEVYELREETEKLLSDPESA